MKQPVVQDAILGRLISLAEAAKITDESLAVWRKRVNRRQISFVKLGRNVRLRRDDFARFIAARLVEPD
jgi:excisionase family DNA binding protein